MNGPSSSHWPSARRLLQHAALMGLLAAVGFGMGRILFSGSSAASIALGALAVFGYMLVRLLLRIDRAESQLTELRQQLVEDSRQAETLTSLAAMINPKRPLPPTRGWAMSPDILCYIASLILEQKPQVVLEASSGVSTIVIGYCLKQIGKGNVIALEHDANFAAVTKQQICEHELQKFAQVIHAPLVTQQVNGQPAQWYDLSGIAGLDGIELFVIDGPPSINDGPQQARFPALPLLFQRLASGCRIVLDDADRQEERSVVQLWLRQFPNLRHQHLQCEKGASILTLETNASIDPDSD